MDPREAQKIENAKAIWLASQNKQGQIALGALLTCFAIYILPGLVPAPYGLTVMVLGGAAGVTTQLSLCPEFFRSRSGSLKPAFWLLGFLWLCAAATTLGTFFGAIR